MCRRRRLEIILVVVPAVEWVIYSGGRYTHAQEEEKRNLLQTLTHTQSLPKWMGKGFLKRRYTYIHTHIGSPSSSSTEAQPYVQNTALLYTHAHTHTYTEIAQETKHCYTYGFDEDINEMEVWRQKKGKSSFSTH